MRSLLQRNVLITAMITISEQSRIRLLESDIFWGFSQNQSLKVSESVKTRRDEVTSSGSQRNAERDDSRCGAKSNNDRKEAYASLDIKIKLKRFISLKKERDTS